MKMEYEDEDEDEMKNTTYNMQHTTYNRTSQASNQSSTSTLHQVHTARDVVEMGSGVQVLVG